MSGHSKNLVVRVVLRERDNEHFEGINDFICFQRHLIKNFTWNHGALNKRSHVDIEFHDVKDALMFKLTHG